jgi:hypothetical protein
MQIEEEDLYDYATTNFDWMAEMGAQSGPGRRPGNLF